MTVSVVIPTYNRSTLLRRAVDSVLAQTYDDLEVIVVDDASSDDTPSVMQQYDDDRISYVRLEKNGGGAHARNVGINEASGEFVAFLDDDDEWHPQKLERQIEHLEELPEGWVGVYCDVRLDRSSILKRLFDLVNVTEGGHPTGDVEVQAGLLTLTAFVHGGSTLLVHRDAVEQIDGFDEDFPRRQDIEFALRLTNVGKLSFVDEELVTLHETPNASPDDVLEAQKLLLEKFDDEVKRVEAMGNDVTGVHNLYVTRQLLRKGEFWSASTRLFKSRPKNIRHVSGLFVDSVRGVIQLIP